jgi:hypothetical protein
MIEVMENTFPMRMSQSETLSSGEGTGHLRWFEPPKYSELDPGYFVQGGRFRGTGWSSVIHAKAEGVAHREQSTEIISRRPPESVKVLRSRQTITDKGVRWRNTTPSDIDVAFPADGMVHVAYQYAGTYMTTNKRLYNILVAKGELDVVSKRMRKIRCFGQVYYNTSNKTINQRGSAGDFAPSSFTGHANSESDGLLIAIAAYSMACFNKPWKSKVGLTMTTVRAPSGTKYVTDGEICEKLSRELGLLSAAANEELHLREKWKLQATAFDSINTFDGNMLALVSDLKSFGTGTFRSLRNAVKDYKDIRKYASLWLTARYGDKLTVRDLQDLAGNLSKSRWREFRTARYIIGKSRGTVSRDGMRFNFATQIAVVPSDYNAIMKGIRRAYEMDLYPSLGNVWDLIPYSFVVDWFVNVSSILESLDRMVQARYYNVACVMQSVKGSCTSDSYPGINLSYYSRELTSELSLGVSSVELGLPSSINIVDGVSLILAG